MIDESFTKGYKPSFDGRFVLRLFRLPDQDGQMRFSFELMLQNGGYVFYRLPDTLWLDRIDQLDWCADCNILFFTVLCLQKAFIYDVTFMTQVSCDLKPNDQIHWDEKEKMWRIFESRVTFSSASHSKSFGDNYYLKLPYPTDTPQPEIKVIPTPNPRYVLVLSRVKKSKDFEPDLWKVGILDGEKFLWVVEELPYHVMEDAIRFRDNHYLDCYGLNPQHTCCYLFRFNCDDIPEQGKLMVFVNDFSPTYPEKVVWEEENQFWRAVIKGIEIHPRPFYFDNMYSKELPVVSKPVPLVIMERLPKTEKQQSQVEAMRQEKKRQMEEEYRRNNTSGSEILSQMSKQPRRKRTWKRKRNKSQQKLRSTRSKKQDNSFMDSPWAIVLPIVILIAMITVFFANVASGNNVGPVATKNLFSAIAILVMFLIGVIVRRRNEKYGGDFVMPYIQRVLMAPLSVFVFIGLIIAYMKVLDFWRIQFHWAVVSAAPTIALLLIMYGTRMKREAKTNKQYNIGCWLQWLSVWIIMMFVISLSKTIDTWGTQSTIEQITFCPSHLMMRPGYFWISP